MKLTSYTSPRTFAAETVFPLVIPQHSIILSVAVRVFNSATGTVTLQTTPVNDELARRIIFIDDITAAGYYTGNSAKDYFVHKQNLVVKITGELLVEVKILFWEVNE